MFVCFRKSDIQWYAVFVDESNKEIKFKQSDLFFFPMSLCVRWYSVVFPEGVKIKQVYFYATNPVYYDEKGQGMHNRLVVCLPLLAAVSRFHHM